MRRWYDLIEQNVKVAVVATILLYLPCLLLTLLLPTTTSELPRRLTFDVFEEGTETFVSIGTPPKPTRFSISGTECGIVVWGRTATDSASWISARTTTATVPHDPHPVALPSIRDFGEDFVTVEGARAFLPMRFVANGERPGASGDDTIQGMIGLCPEIPSAWHLLPDRSASYFARCERLVFGGGHPDQTDCLVEECGTKEIHEDREKEETERNDFFGIKPWIVRGWHHLEFDVFHSGARRDREEEEDFGHADCDALATFTTKSGSHVFPCVPCSRKTDAVVTTLIVTAILVTTWVSVIGTPGTHWRILGTVSAGASVVTICFYVAMRLGSDAGCVIAREAGFSERWLVAPTFFVGIVLLAAANLIILILLRHRRSDLVMSRERILTEVPLLAAFWYIAHIQPIFFARILIVGGAAAMLATMTTTIALTSALMRERRRTWLLCSAVGGSVNAAVMMLTGLPLASLVFGCSVPMRLATGAIFFVVTAFPALLLATGRVLNIYAYEKSNR